MMFRWFDVTALMQSLRELIRTEFRLHEQADLIGLRAENVLLRTQLAIVQNNFDWARTRMNQIEQERAILLAKVLHIVIPVPAIERTAMPGNTPLADSDYAGMGLSFEDVGDDAAKVAGIEHDDAGRVEYRK